jgi:hypothetical protein
MAKKPNRRGHKKEILKRFEQSFDLKRLNLAAEIKRIKPKAMLIGLMSAMVLYGVGFAAAYAGMNANAVPLELFAKLVWILMIPTTIIGFFAWQLSRSRMEYPVRMEIREYIQDLEDNGGLLWRFAPLLEADLDQNPDVKKAFAWSAEAKIDQLDIDDYILAVDMLDDILRSTAGKFFTQEMCNRLEENFTQTANAA